MHYSDLRQSPEDREKFRASIEVSLPIFQKDFRERTREEQDELFSFLNQIPFFNEHFVSTSDKEEALLDLSKAFKYEKVPRYTALYHHGDIPQKFYLILKGDLKGFIPKTPEEIEKDVKRQAELKAEAVKSKANRSKKNGKGNKGNGEQRVKSFGMDKKYFTEDALNFKMRKSCYPGDYLSELSIVFNSPEDDTAISWTELHLVSIEKKVYRQIFHREIEETREKLNFFFELFPQVEEDVVKTFAYAFEKRIYGSHYEVFQQGMNSDTLYAIKKGEVELWENINLNENTEKGGVNSPTIKSHHKLEKKLNGNQGMMKVSVVLLSQGQFFGEEILLGVGQRIFSAVTKSVNMLVYSISGRALLKLSHGFPDFLGYLKSQTRTSFESKLQRQGNLKKGFERINPKKNSSPPHKAKDEIEVKKKTKTLGDDQAENFSKEVMSMYLNEAMRGRDPAKKSNDSIRLQKVSEEVGGVVSPKIAQMYERMAKVRASVIHDKIKVDPTMLTEAEEAKLENKEGDRIIPQIGNLDIDLSRKFYYPEELWNSVKKGKKNNRGSKKVRQANLEKTLAKKLMDEASYELEMERKSALTINTEITSTDYDRAKVKEKSASPLKTIIKTMNSQSSDVYDDSGKEFGSASAVLLNHLRSSIRREREDSLPSGSDIPSSKFKIQDYISLSSSPKLKFAKKTGGGSTSKTSLPTISTSKSVEKLPGLFISRIEGGDPQQARFPKKKSKTMVKEPPKEILLSPKSQSIVDKLGTLESARDHKEGLIKMSKLEDRNSYRSFDATRVNSIMMDSQLTVNGKDYIAAAQGLKEMQLAIDTNVGSYQDVLESEVRGWDKTPDDPQKKIKLPKISNKKLINSKHSMFRLKPSNAKFIQDYYLPKRNMLP